MTKQQKLQQDIQFAQNRLAVKQAYIPTLEVNVSNPTMKQRYYDGIAQEQQLIAKLSAKLAK